MKKQLIILTSLLCSNLFVGQNFYLKIKGATIAENKTIDSIGYKNSHTNTKSLITEYNMFSDRLIKLGYIDIENKGNDKPNDSTFTFKCVLGKKIKHTYIKVEMVDEISFLEEFKSDTIKISFEETENFIKNISKKLENKGYSMAKTVLKTIRKSDNILYCELKIESGQKRYLNDIVFNGYEKFPVNHKKNLIRLFKNKTFNQENLENLYTNINNFRFINQTKYPEILFKKDSTIAYAYLEKSKSNTFDGIIGFSNNEQQKIVFNGYLDLLLNNILNSGERLSLFWKSDGQEQRTFAVNFDLPYLFNSPIGLKTELHIFKQDSTFQNTKTSLDLGYFFNYNTRLYLGYESKESSDIQNTNSFSISDFKNKFYTSTFEYIDLNREDFLFPEKINLRIKIGTGNRTSKFQKNSQLFTSVNTSYNLYLNNRNSINLKLESFYLKSDEYIINEIYRFGGINSIRGFKENSLQASFLSSFQTEYRYRLASNLYIHSIIDYAYYEDKSISSTNTLYGAGFGFGIITKNGLINIIYANGSTKEQSIKLSNSIIHLSLKTNF
ncbi:hypothetical protein [Flavobacterium sp.]